MEKKNSVFIAISMDGYIADRDGGIEWLDTIPEINKIDSGYNVFISNIDALVMGRSTYEKVLSFDIEWPYQKPVFVMSSSIAQVPGELKGKVYIVNGALPEVLKSIHIQGFNRLYIDGGKVIQSFLKEDLIDEMIITTIPVILGGGYSLFGDQENVLRFNCLSSIVYLDAIVQNHFIRIRK